MSELNELEVELGGLKLRMAADDTDDGLDDVSEVEGEDDEGGLDGGPAISLELKPRPITLRVYPQIGPTDLLTAAEVYALWANELRKVMSPLPDRAQTRTLRWRRPGEVTKRIEVQPAVGRALQMPTGRSALQYFNPDQPATLRLTAPDPVVLSDAVHSETFTAGQTKTLVNAGSFTAVSPMAWALASPAGTGGLIVEHLDFGEYIAFPARPLLISRQQGIYGPAGTYGVAYGRDLSPFPSWPVLRPGNNSIRCSAPATIQWRDSW